MGSMSAGVVHCSRVQIYPAATSTAVSTTMDNYHRACIVAAFLTGVALALGLKDAFIYFQGDAGDPTDDDIPEAARTPPSTICPAGLDLQDNTNRSVKNTAESTIALGIEGCIGNTPLLKIKSLSEATGCNILAKAEVWRWALLFTT